jgi:hypothetical protein
VTPGVAAGGVLHSSARWRQLNVHVLHARCCGVTRLCLYRPLQVDSFVCVPDRTNFWLTSARSANKCANGVFQICNQVSEAANMTGRPQAVQIQPQNRCRHTSLYVYVLQQTTWHVLGSGSVTQTPLTPTLSTPSHHHVGAPQLDSMLQLSAAHVRPSAVLQPHHHWWPWLSASTGWM